MLGRIAPTRANAISRLSLPRRAVIFFGLYSEEGMKKIFVTVSGGCAYVIEDTVPPGYVVEIIDFDNIGAGGAFPSETAREYCLASALYDPSRIPQG